MSSSGSVLAGGSNTFGAPGGPGFISPFDLAAAGAGETESLTAMTNQYNRLGLGQNSASPAGATTGATPGIPGSGTTPVNPGSFGSGSTPYQMDVGTAPSLTGGIPEQFQAVLGEGQTQDLGSTVSSALSSIAQKQNQIGGITSIGSGLTGLF